MKKTTITAFVATFLTGALLGRYLPQTDNAEVSPAVIEAGSSASVSARSYRRNPPRQRRSHEQAPGETTGPDSNLISVPKNLLESLSLAAGKRTVGQPLFNRDGKLESALQMTDSEKASVQTAWRDSLQKVRDLEAAISTSKDLEDGAVQITVPQLSMKVEEIGVEFQSSVRAILGDKRGEIFLTMKQIDHLFVPAEGERIYTVRTEPTGEGRWRFHMTLEDNQGRRVWVGSRIPDEIRHLTDAASIVPVQ